MKIIGKQETPEQKADRRRKVRITRKILKDFGLLSSSEQMAALMLLQGSRHDSMDQILGAAASELAAFARSHDVKSNAARAARVAEALTFAVAFDATFELKTADQWATSYLDTLRNQVGPSGQIYLQTPRPSLIEVGREIQKFAERLLLHADAMANSESLPFLLDRTPELSKITAHQIAVCSVISHFMVHTIIRQGVGKSADLSRVRIEFAGRLVRTIARAGAFDPRSIALTCIGCLIGPKQAGRYFNADIKAGARDVRKRQKQAPSRRS